MPPKIEGWVPTLSQKVKLLKNKNLLNFPKLFEFLFFLMWTIQKEVGNQFGAKKNALTFGQLHLKKKLLTNFFWEGDWGACQWWKEPTKPFFFWQEYFVFVAFVFSQSWCFLFEFRPNRKNDFEMLPTKSPEGTPEPSDLVQGRKMMIKVESMFDVGYE